MKNYLMTDEITGEEFIVEARDGGEAKTIAKQYFEKPQVVEPISDWEAEALGLDTY